MFIPIWGRFPFWLTFFRWVEPPTRTYRIHKKICHKHIMQVTKSLIFTFWTTHCCEAASCLTAPSGYQPLPGWWRVATAVDSQQPWPSLELIFSAAGWNHAMDVMSCHQKTPWKPWRMKWYPDVAVMLEAPHLWILMVCLSVLVYQTVNAGLAARKYFIQIDSQTAPCPQLSDRNIKRQQWDNRQEKTQTAKSKQQTTKQLRCSKKKKKEDNKKKSNTINDKWQEETTSTTQAAATNKQANKQNKKERKKERRKEGRKERKKERKKERRKEGRKERKKERKKERRKEGRKERKKERKKEGRKERKKERKKGRKKERKKDRKKERKTERKKERKKEGSNQRSNIEEAQNNTQNKLQRDN